MSVIRIKNFEDRLLENHEKNHYKRLQGLNPFAIEDIKHCLWCTQFMEMLDGLGAVKIETKEEAG